MSRFILLFGFSILVFLTNSSLAGIPKMINYPGMLTENSGHPLADTTVSMTFKICNDSTGGSIKWQETRSNVSVKDGLFNVILGKVNPMWGMRPATGTVQVTTTHSKDWRRASPTPPVMRTRSWDAKSAIPIRQDLVVSTCACQVRMNAYASLTCSCILRDRVRGPDWHSENHDQLRQFLLPKHHL